MDIKTKITERIAKEKSFFDAVKILPINELSKENISEVKKELKEMLKDGRLYSDIYKREYIQVGSHKIKSAVVMAIREGNTNKRELELSIADKDNFDIEYSVFVPSTFPVFYRDEIKIVYGKQIRILNYVNPSFEYIPGSIINNQFKPYFPNVFIKYDILESDIDILEGDRVEAQILHLQDKIAVRVTRLLGRLGDRYGYTLEALLANGFKDKFDNKVLSEADEVSQKAININKRTDFTKLLTITIDGDDSKDFDDAISIEKTNSGYRLYVHIADVSEYVTMNSKLDKEAAYRATSVYTPEAVFPMLPEVLSNGVCSLNPNEKRFAVTAILDFDNDGEMISGDIKESLIQSDYRLTYKKVEEVFCGNIPNDYDKVKDVLLLMYELSKKIDRRREKQAVLNLVTVEYKFKIENNNVSDVCENKQLYSNKLIENFMVAANSFVAQYLTRKSLPALYRVHGEPDLNKLDIAAKTLENLAEHSIKLNLSSLSSSFNKEIEKLKDIRIKKVVSYIMLRCLAKAKYETKDLGHYGLALKHYCHFTSPIRRYPDLIVHRAIKADLRNNKEEIVKLREQISSLAKHTSLMEANAAKVERQLDSVYKAMYIENKLGKTFDGIITSVTQHGMYVEIEKGIEGLVRFDAMPFDYYNIFLNSYVGRKYCFSVGDKISVVLDYVNVSNGKIDFRCKGVKKRERC